MGRESKAELTDRLRREGRFDAFKTRREELKAQDVPAAQAWFEAAVEFGPMTPENDATKPTIDLQPLKGKPSIPIEKAAAWAFEFLDADWITPADAPSPGAWSMREWARSSPSARSDFYKTFVAKIVMPPQEQERSVKEKRRSHEQEVYKRLFGDIDRLLEKPEAEEDEPLNPEEEQEAYRRIQSWGEIPKEDRGAG